ncbi:MAG: radical SAM protein [Candidatus Kapabacteria bacterium]|nr:radical SAM protein [Candidatus Kapabacteria bacterium]
MYFKQKSKIIFRNFESFGYITDNRNFGYQQINDNENYIGDKILSESGAVFLSVLDKYPQTIEELVIKINKKFTDADIGIIKNDAIEFYNILEGDGFIVSGKTFQECDIKDTKFSYKTFEPDTAMKDFSRTIFPTEKSTQNFFEEYFKDVPQLTNLHIEITSICNERCIHCYIPHDYKVSYIDDDLFYDVLEQCKNMKLLHLTLSGGEPMLHKNFCGFLKKCREYGFSVNVLSNLTLLNDEIIKEMKANPLLGVNTSLYSMDSNIHDEITQMKGSFDKTKKAILHLIENDIPLQISCPIMKQNKNCYKSVVNWGRMNNIHVGDDYVIIARYDHSIQNLSCRLSINEIKNIIIDKVENDAKFMEQTELAIEQKKNSHPNDSVCSVCHSSVCISENGNVYPCAGWQDYLLGNVKEASLDDIWYKSEKVHYLRGLRKKDFPKCIECPDKVFCTMCMVRNSNENPLGDPLIINEYFCSIAKLNRQIMLEIKEKQINS